MVNLGLHEFFQRSDVRVRQGGVAGLAIVEAPRRFPQRLECARDRLLAETSDDGFLGRLPAGL